MKADYVGQLIANEYLVQSHLGGGGMAQVYLAVSNRTGQQVAVKIMHAELLRKSKAVERFKREARLTCRLNHPNLVKGIATGEFEGFPYLVMEYISGPTLSDLIAKRSFLPPEEAMKILYNIAAALSYLYREGSIHAHRDIKPENIMLADGGNIAKLTDFGIAKALDDGESMTLTSSFLGSPHYMSPEQINNPRDVDIRSDIYALGAVFYEMLTGHKAYDGQSTKEILDAHFELEAPQITGDNPLIAVCNEIFRRTMAISPLQRYQTPQELVMALAPYVDPQIIVKDVRWSRQSIKFAIALASVAVVALIAIIGVLKLTSKISIDSDHATPNIKIASVVQGDITSAHQGIVDMSGRLKEQAKSLTGVNVGTATTNVNTGGSSKGGTGAPGGGGTNTSGTTRGGK